MGSRTTSKVNHHHAATDAHQKDRKHNHNHNHNHNDMHNLMDEEEPESARIHETLGGLYLEQHRYPDALREFRESLGILEKTGGKNNILVARNHDCQGDILCLLHRDEEAMAEFQESIKTYIRVCGEEVKETANPFVHMGVLLAKHNDYVGAKEYFTKALEIEEHAQGVEPSEIREIRKVMKLLLQKQAKDSHAQEDTAAQTRTETAPAFKTSTCKTTRRRSSSKTTRRRSEPLSASQAQVLFEGWRDRFFAAEQQFRRLYNHGGTPGEFHSLDKSLHKLRRDAAKFGPRSTRFELFYTPYEILISELHSACEQQIQSENFHAQRSPDSHVGGVISATASTVSDSQPEENPLFHEWKLMFIEVEKKYQALILKGADQVEYESILRAFRTRVIRTEVVEENVGFAPLHPYIALEQAYERVIRHEISHLPSRQR